MHRSLLALLLLLPLVATGCQPPLEDQARTAATQGDHALAADLYLEAAKAVPCPDRGRLLLARAEMLELDGQQRSAVRSIDKAIELCPKYVEGWWARAQRAFQAGDRDQAMADAGRIKDVLPEAAEMYSDLAMEVEVEAGMRRRTEQLVSQIAGMLDIEAPTEKLDRTDQVVFARHVPVPVTLKYQVQQSVRGDSTFDLKWEEVWSYRGDSIQETHNLVRTLELPPLERTLPLPVRLTMSNQRLPMRFLVSDRGKVLEAEWLSKGPDRGMRPEMLRPEIEGALKRRRIFEPGESGRRGPGDTWRGEDVRVVDGKPVTVPYAAEAVGFESVRGLVVLRIKTKFESEDYRGGEELWIHPETAIPVRWVRDVQYTIESDWSVQRWRDHSEGVLSAVQGSG